MKRGSDGAQLDMPGWLAAALAAAAEPGWLHARQVAANMARLQAEAAAVGTRRKGFGVDGKPVSDSFKRRTWERYERMRAEHYARQARLDASQPVVYASASPQTRRLFGLDG
jgi:hypothetical protein